MNKIFLIGLLVLFLNINLSFAQTIDLTSVDEFFKVTSTLKEGKEISEEQWKDFDNSISYKGFAESENKFLINTIKSSINIAFGEGVKDQIDSILRISQKEMIGNKRLLLKKQILINYLESNDNYVSLKSFRENYDFSDLVEKAKQRLSIFLGQPIDTTTKLKSVYFLFITADGKNNKDALYIDFNFIYKKTEEQRINFLAHEFFHNYREHFENHDFNYKNDLNYSLDMIQNEGIADLIDKHEGYKKYFTKNGELTEIGEIFVSLYNQAQNDLARLHNLIIKYSKDKITENEMIDELQKIVKYNGHSVGFFMANHIVSAGYKKEMLAYFYNPYEFFNLYNKVAKEQNLFQFSNDFMEYLNGSTKEYYR